MSEALDMATEEYRSLREEIMQRQQGRGLTLGFTFTAVATIVGLSLAPESAISTDARGALLGFGLLLVIAAELSTIRTIQRVFVIGSYIKERIEPRYEGVEWETAISKYRESRKNKRRERLLMRPEAIYYLCLGAGTLLIGVLKLPSAHAEGWLWLLAPLFAVDVLLSWDLASQRLPGWKNVPWAELLVHPKAR